MSKAWLLAGALAALGAASVVAQSQGSVSEDTVGKLRDRTGAKARLKERVAGRLVSRLAKRLALEPRQSEQIAALIEGEIEASWPEIERLRAQRRALRRDVLKRALAKAEDVLTPEQKVKWETLRKGKPNPR